MSRLKRTASDSMDIRTDLYLLLEKYLEKKAKEIGYKGPVTDSGVAELVDQNMDVYGSGNIENIAQSMYLAIERWAEETQQNFPEELE